jgi:CAAX protease family protein
MRATTALPRPTTTPVLSGLRLLLQRHPVTVYFVLVFTLAWGALLPVLGGPLSASGNDRIANPLFVLAILAGPLAPSIASVPLTGVLDGRAGYRELLGRLRRWRVDGRWYAAALLAGPLPILAAAVLLAALLSAPEFLPGILTAPPSLGLVLLGVVVGLVAGISATRGGEASPTRRRW